MARPRNVRRETARSSARGGSSVPRIKRGSARRCRHRRSPSVKSRRAAVGDAEPEIADAAWAQLLDDPSRSVRRAAVDAMVDAERETLRPVLERALLDSDAWIRWKALVGLAALDIDPSRDAVTPLAGDTDFRVRLEAAPPCGPSNQRNV